MNTVLSVLTHTAFDQEIARLLGAHNALRHHFIDQLLHGCFMKNNKFSEWILRLPVYGPLGNESSSSAAEPDLSVSLIVY